MKIIKKLLAGLVKSVKTLFASNKYIRSKAGKLIIFSCFMVLIWLGYIAFSMFSLSPSQIALAELEKSYTTEKICHEECYLWRQGKESLIVSNLINKRSDTEKELYKYWISENTDLDFKKEVVRLNFLAYGKGGVPEYLKRYINDENYESSLATLIISLFDLDLSDLTSLDFALNNKFSLATSSAEKIETLKVKASLGNDLEIDTYFSLLNTSGENDVKRELIKNISSIREKNNFYTLSQLEIIKSIILNPETDIRVRQDLVLLIGDYYLIYPEESATLWFEIYNNEALDNISRLFSADSLNHLKKLNLSLPEVSEIDWEAYYNQ